MNLLFAIFWGLMTTMLPTTNLTVTITDIDKAGDGTIYLFLWDKDQDFPRSVENAVYQGVVRDFSDSGTFKFTDIPNGKYAVSAFQDLNNNKKLDANFIGIPKEPVGAYNQNSMGKPKFNKSLIDLNGAPQAITLEMIND
ncbi:MAG: DUF2141 domain-containing protein [Bacteroidota bacterium]